MRSEFSTTQYVNNLSHRVDGVKAAAIGRSDTGPHPCIRISLDPYLSFKMEIARINQTTSEYITPGDRIDLTHNDQPIGLVNITMFCHSQCHC